MEILKPDGVDHGANNGKDQGRYSDIMGLADFLATTSMQRQAEELARLLITGTNKPLEALPRSILSMQELKLKQRVALRRNAFLFGAAKHGERETFDLIGRSAVEGIGRKQAIHVHAHTPMPRRMGPMGRTAEFENGTGPTQGPP